MKTEALNGNNPSLTQLGTRMERERRRRSHDIEGAYYRDTERPGERTHNLLAVRQ